MDTAIRETFDAHEGSYGSPRIAEDLWEAGWTVSVNTVAARMQAPKLRAKPARLRRSLTRPDKGRRPFPDLINRSFNPPAPNVVWCGDITEVSTWELKMYVATVIDLYSRRPIGWAIRERHTADLVCNALRMAHAVRGGDSTAGVIFHSDRGSEYTSHAFTALCTDLGVRQSMGRVGSCLDNAVAESFFATLKTELVYQRVLTTTRQTRQLLVDWFDRYNRIRRHSHCGTTSPITYEKENTTIPTPRAA